MHKYGDVLYVHTWGRRWNPSTYHPFCYRQDPVPGIYKYTRNFGNWYKTPRVGQEKRLSYAYPEYVRGKRRKPNLPDPWDDYQRSDIRTRKSWKNKKIRKQWMKNISFGEDYV